MNCCDNDSGLCSLFVPIYVCTHRMTVVCLAWSYPYMPVGYTQNESGFYSRVCTHLCLYTQTDSALCSPFVPIYTCTHRMTMVCIAFLYPSIPVLTKWPWFAWPMHLYLYTQNDSGLCTLFVPIYVCAHRLTADYVACLYQFMSVHT